MRCCSGWTARGLLATMLFASCMAPAAQEFAGREKLRVHSAEFRREVIKVTEGVWVAVGFSDSNSALIAGNGGSIGLPDKRVLLPGDDFYKSFPTLYAIRGARLRPIDQWIASLGLMIDLGADHLVPGHTRPVLGSANVRAALTAYRGGIKSILDQTLEGMRKGERPDELVQHVALPQQSCFRCPKKIARPESSSSAAVANRCFRGHAAPSPTRTFSGPPS